MDQYTHETCQDVEQGKETQKMHEPICAKTIMPTKMDQDNSNVNVTVALRATKHASFILRRTWVQILGSFCQFFFSEKSEVPAKNGLNSKFNI